MIEYKIYKLLSADTTVTGFVSTRIYPVPLPQRAAFPCLSYERVGGERIYTLSGYAGLENPIFEFVIYATASTALDKISSAVKKAIDEGTTAFKAVCRSEDEAWDEDKKARVRIIEYSLWNQE